MKILFIEDNEVTVRHLLHDGKDHDITVHTTAADGAEALRKGGYDFAVVDWFLDRNVPTGLMLIQSARAAGVTKPLILVTASSGETYERLTAECAKLKDVLIVQKPYTLRHLVNVIRLQGVESPSGP